MPPASRLASTLAVAAVAAAAAAAPAAAARPPQAPRGLAFYSPPQRLLAGAHGSVIWSRPAQPSLRLAAASKTVVVVYRSRSVSGKAIPVSGVVWIPRGRAPRGGWPLISWAHGTTGVADVCAPSRIGPGSPVTAYATYVFGEFTAWLKAGYAVAQTDYEGLGTQGPHPYLIGHSEGRGVDDMALAAHRLVSAIGTRFAIAGHSQGGQAALFAAADAPSWVPAMRLLAVDADAPASHISTQIKAAAALTTPSGLSALGAEIVSGAGAVSAKVTLRGLLSDAAQPFVGQLQTRCEQQLGQKDSFGSLAPSQLLRPGADVGALLAVTDGENPALRIRVPVLLNQGDADQTVFKTFTDQLSSELKALGDDVTYTIYPGVSHGGIVAASQAAFSAWVKQRFGR